MEVVIIKKPNSLCKNEHCRKPFYACAYCTRTNAWRAVTCSLECFNAYTEQVTAARAAKKNLNLAPERTDMTEAEMQELMSKPINEVIEITKEELKEYSNEMATHGLGGTIDLINKEIREAENLGGLTETEVETETPPLSTPAKRTRTKTNKT